jgi:hypothetical protein
MPDFSLVPVDYQPDFGDVSLLPVDYDPFADGITQQAQAQPAQIQTQPAQPQPQSPPPPAAAGAGQSDVGAPAIDGGPSGSQGGNGVNRGGSDARGGPNPTLDRDGAEPLPFNGYANPTPTESLVNQQKMADQRTLVEADRTGNSGAITDGGDLYGLVTTQPTHRYLTPDHTGLMFTATSPFYAFDGIRYALIDASPARPLTVTVGGDGKFTISGP